MFKLSQALLKAYFIRHLETILLKLISALLSEQRSWRRQHLCGQVQGHGRSRWATRRLRPSRAWCPAWCWAMYPPGPGLSIPAKLAATLRKRTSERNRLFHSSDVLDYYRSFILCRSVSVLRMCFNYFKVKLSWIKLFNAQVRSFRIKMEFKKSQIPEDAINAKEIDSIAKFLAHVRFLLSIAYATFTNSLFEDWLEWGWNNLPCCLPCFHLPYNNHYQEEGNFSRNIICPIA